MMSSGRKKNLKYFDGSDVPATIEVHFVGTKKYVFSPHGEEICVYSDSTLKLLNSALKYLSELSWFEMSCGLILGKKMSGEKRQYYNQYLSAINAYSRYKGLNVIATVSNELLFFANKADFLILKKSYEEYFNHPSLQTPLCLSELQPASENLEVEFARKVRGVRRQHRLKLFSVANRAETAMDSSASLAVAGIPSAVSLVEAANDHLEREEAEVVDILNGMMRYR